MKTHDTGWMISSFAVILFAFFVIQPLFGFAWYLGVLVSWFTMRLVVLGYQIHLLRTAGKDGR